MTILAGFTYSLKSNASNELTKLPRVIYISKTIVKLKSKVEEEKIQIDDKMQIKTKRLLNVKAIVVI